RRLPAGHQQDRRQARRPAEQPAPGALAAPLSQRAGREYDHNMVQGLRDLPGTPLSYFSLEAGQEAGLGDVGRLPVTVKLLLEMLLRQAERSRVSEASLRALAGWPDASVPEAELPYTPARVLLQDFTGVPAV